MARLLVFADRPPDDFEWKGSVVWNMILSLAEAHHEVLALTTLDLDRLESISHPRLTLAQPAPSFGIRYLGRWLRAILQFQPQIVHTFALTGERGPGLLGQISSWPAMVQTLNAFPGLQRWSTVLDDRDFAPFPAVNAPLEFDLNASDAKVALRPPFENFVVVPAPVSEWLRPKVDLLMLADFLENNAEVGACVVGGWGDWGLRERREGWALLEALSARVHLTPALDLSTLTGLTRESRGLWLRPLSPASWRALMAQHLAETLSLPAHGGPSRRLASGSTANFLSRLYSNN